MRCFQMQKIRGIVSGGGEASALIQNEVLILSDEERRSLFDKAGISSSIELGAAEVLAIKAGLATPWNKLTLLRRWLKSSGICLAGEERMRHISSQIVGDNLKGEIALFSFTIPSGGEEIKGAPLVFIPRLVDKVVQLLDGNESFFAAGDSVTNLHVAFDRFRVQDATLAYIAKFQVTRWLHLYLFEGMPQKGHLRICILTTSAMSHQVCPPGLHIMLGIFTKMFHLLKALCCQLDLELASHTTDFNSSNFSKYSQALQRKVLQVLQQV
eukprot:Em0021g995a